jgi:drug/metabolite transporter (DMT)-like permease
MTTAAFALVLASAVMHATWNFLLKRSTHKVIFFWGMSGIGLLILLVPAVVFAVVDGFGWTQLWYALGTAALHAGYGVLLTRGYTIGDLSSVYPVSRGMGPALVPILAVIFLDEHISTEAVIGIALVIAGIYTIHIDQRFLRDFSHPVRALTAPATRAAFATGFMIALYSIWDKAGLDHDLHPVILSVFSLGAYCLVLTPAVGAVAGGDVVRNEWRGQWKNIVAAGVLAPSGYLLVLIALQTSRVSYIAPTREVGIVLGAALGVWMLGEGYGLSRIWGALLVVAGVITIALAP